MDSLDYLKWGYMSYLLMVYSRWWLLCGKLSNVLLCDIQGQQKKMKNSLSAHNI